MKTHYFIILLFIGICFQATSQNTFNKRFVVSELSVGASIVEIEGKIYVAAIGLDFNNFLTCSIAFSDSGDVESHQCYGYDEPFSLGFFIDGDGFSEVATDHFCFGSCVFPNTLGCGYYMLFDSSNQLVRFHQYLSPMYDSELGDNSASSVRSSGISTEDGHIFLSYGASPQYAENLVDTGIICFDETDEIQWEKQWATADNDRIQAMAIYEDFLFAAVLTSPTNILIDGHILMYKLNIETGVIEDSWETPWDFHMTEALEMISVDDGIIIVGSSVNIEGINTDAVITKVDGNMNEIWTNIIENPDTTYRRSFEELVQTTDGNYVAAGEWKYRLPQFDEENGYSNDDGWLVKFDALSGEIMWDMKYHLIEDTNDEHDILDLVACADGGVAFTGDALDLTTAGEPDYEYPVQQGWVVKVDSFGCIIPGCQENSVSELNSEKAYFKAGPNPLAHGQNLHIYLGSEVTGTFILRDSQGKEIKSFPAHSKNTTYTWELGIISGSYVLSLVDGGRVLQSEKVLKE